MLETFQDTCGNDATGALFISTRDGETSACPDNDHGFLRKQRPEHVTTHHEYEAKTWHGVYLLCGLDGPSLLGSAFKHSKAKHSKARARLHCVLDCVIVGPVPNLNNYVDTPRIQSKNSEHFEGFTMMTGQVLRLPEACLSRFAAREVCHSTKGGCGHGDS